MAQFHWNYIYPTGDTRKAYEKYLQNSEYIKDITDCINYNSNGIKSLLISNNVNTNNINSGIKSICGKLDRGFDMMRNNLSSIDVGIQSLNSEISNISNLLDWKLSLVIEGQKITNQLLGNISSLMKIPDSQKERVYYIEEGLKFLKNALLENSNSDFFEEAYSSFFLALGKESKDYISLSRIGFIHLYSSKYLDLPKSEEYFRKSIRYSTAEANVQGTNTSNTLNPFAPDFNLNENIHLISTVESMLYCARACALQNKLNEAIELTTNAYLKVPTFLTAGYEAAKYLCLNNQVEQALAYIEDIIDKDRFQSLRVIADPDIMKHNEVSLKLEQIKIKYLNEAVKLGKSIEKIINPNSVFIRLFRKFNVLKEENTILSVKEGIDILTNSYSWCFSEYQKVDNIRIKRNKKLIGSNNSDLPFGCYNVTKRYEKQDIPNFVQFVNDTSSLLPPQIFLISENNSFAILENIKKEIGSIQLLNLIYEKKTEVRITTLMTCLGICVAISLFLIYLDYKKYCFSLFIGFLAGWLLGELIAIIINSQIDERNVNQPQILIE